MKHFISVLLCYFFITTYQYTYGQDSITIEDLEQFTYSLSIVEGGFNGEGGAVLNEAIASAHITLLGENVGSKLEHQFTNALMNELDRNNYKRMVLEVGGGSGALINKMAKESEFNVQTVKALNQKYLLEKEGRTFIPILELKTVDLMQSLQKATERDWEFLSVGIEPWTSYKMLVDELYGNLVPRNKEAYKKLYEETLTFLNDRYSEIKTHNSKEVHQFISPFESSKSFNDFLQKMAVCEGNRVTIKALRESIEYWGMYGHQEYYRKNIWNAKKDREKLQHDLDKGNFDFDEDKLFVKMYRNHLSKGMSANGAYGVGNMLMEKASAHGNETLSIGIVRRFYKEGDELKDMLKASDGFNKYYRKLVQLGKQKEWVLIDLRPFVEEFYYGNYIQDAGIAKMYTRYDFLVIPMTDESATANY